MFIIILYYFAGLPFRFKEELDVMLSTFVCVCVRVFVCAQALDILMQGNLNSQVGEDVYLENS